MEKVKDLIRYFLVESEIFNEKEVSLMNTDSINDSIREVAKAILGSIIEKKESIDTSVIDKSKGDVKQLPNLDSLQTAVTQLESMVERSMEDYDTSIVKYIKEIERALMNLNKYSMEFKEAYRSRKTLLILRYQSLIMSIFSSLSYLISVMIDFSSGELELKGDVSYMEIAPLKTIIEFNRSVEKGDFKETMKEVSLMREHFSEIQKLESPELLESYDISSILMDGIKMIYNSFSNNPKLMDFLYKAAGIITLLMSLREVFYMVFKAKSKISDIIGHIENFAGASNATPAVIAKLNNFSNKYIVDAEESSKIAKREIESENKSLGQEIRSLPEKLMSVSREPEMEIKREEPSESDEGLDSIIGLDF